jgi:biopolymer transport protein ExbD
VASPPLARYDRKMRIPTRATIGDLGFNMTPMIDVVFQLIIFFLLSSHLARQETQFPLPLPMAESGVPLPAVERPSVVVNVLADGSLLAVGRRVTPEELGALLARRQADHGGDLAVRIRGDRSVPYTRIEPVMRACTQAGIWNVSYGVTPRQETP